MDEGKGTGNVVAVITNKGSGDDLKCLAMLILGLGSFLAGISPIFISERNRSRFPLTISLLLCFGAGILLATALVHILPEVRQQMGSNYAEITLCGGFFVIYLVEELIHYFFGEAVQHAHSHIEHTFPCTINVESVITATSAQGSPQSSTRNYGSTATEVAPLLPSNRLTNDDILPSSSVSYSNRLREPHARTKITEQSCPEGSNARGHSDDTPCDDDVLIEAANARFCHTCHTEPCITQSVTGTLGLFVALSLHSAIEGLAIGVQSSATKVLFLLGAVACHKFVMGFCLGLEFRSNPQTSVRSQIVGITVFALGTVSGIGIGMAIVDVPSGWVGAALPAVQALAGGTLLYVTVCEVMPREKASWHQNPTRKGAGFLQFLSIGCGFTTMTIINYYFNDDKI